MAKIYVKSTWVDEILAGDERYSILEDSGAAFKNTMQIALSTAVTQAGTLADATKMNNLENGLDAVDTRVNNFLSGWIDPGQTWTYASASTFTVPGDQTAVLRVGTKIKLTQTTVKYFYIKAVSYGSPNTTVTVVAGSDYSLANAAITSPFYSYSVLPQGFPDGFNWTPTVTGMTITGTPLYTGKFWMTGHLVRVRVIINPNSGSTASTLITTFVDNLPFTVDQYGVISTVDESSFANLGQGVFSPSLTRIYLPSWTTNAHYIGIFGWVEVT